MLLSYLEVDKFCNSKQLEDIKLYKLPIFIFSLLIPIWAFSHSPLLSSNPKNGAELQSNLTEIVMTFKSPVKLIKLDLLSLTDQEKNSILGSVFKKDNEEKIALPVDDFLRKDKKIHTVPLPTLSSSNYKVKWRALGEDGHIMKGSFNFKIIPNY